MMEQQYNDEFLDDCAGMIMESINQMPTHSLEIYYACVNHTKQHINFDHTPKQISLLQQRFKQINRQAIQNKFILMIQAILSGIEIRLKKQQGNWKDFNQFSLIFWEYLDKTIYNKEHLKRLFPKSSDNNHTPSSKVGSQNQKADRADQFFTMLFEKMHILLQIMKSYYKHDDDDLLQIAMFTAIIQFMQNNKQSFIVEEDRLSMSRISVSSNKSEQKIKDNEDKSILQSLYDTIQSIPIKQKVTEIPSYIYEAIGKGFSYLTSKNPKTSEKQKVKQQLINLLISRRKCVSEMKLDQKDKQIIDKFLNTGPQNILVAMTPNDRKNFIEFLSDVMTQEQCQQFLQETKAHQELSKLVQMTYQIKGQGYTIQNKECLWILLVYKSFEQKYCSSRREYILTLCRKQLIKNKIKNSVQILKYIESSNLKQSELVRLIRRLPVTNSDYQIKKLSHKKTDDLTLHLEHELNRILLYEFKKQYDKIPLMEFHKLSESSPKKNITLLFSGFLSEDSNKFQQWAELVKTGFDSEIYSIRWESKSEKDLYSYIFNAGKDIIGANVGIGAIAAGPYGPYLKAAAVARQLYKKYKENPFNPAFEYAAITGKFVAQLLISSFQGHFINLVGFSLGTQLIFNILQRLQIKNHMHLINRVYLLGGVADKKKLESVLKNQKHIIRVKNMYSENDYVLKYLLKVCKTDLEPIGLNPIDQKINYHKIKNYNGTELVQGHLSYRDNLGLIEVMMQIHD